MAGIPGFGDRRQLGPGELVGACVQRALLVGEMTVERGGGIPAHGPTTAIPMSSTVASGTASPHWTLHAAAEQGYTGVNWIPQYDAGSRKPPDGRDTVGKELGRTFEPVSAPSSRDEPGTPDGLQPQDLVITVLGTYVRPFGGGPVWSGGLVSLLGEFGFSHGAARVALTRLVRRGLLERVRSGRLVHYRVTARCDRLLAEGDGRIFSLGSARATGDWWTVVWHQIPEDRRLERSRLARRLRFLGFGSVQDSVWVSPHDHAAEVEKLVGDLDVASVTAVFLASVGLDARPAGARRPRLGSQRARRSLPGVRRASSPRTPGAGRPVDDDATRSSSAPGSCTCSGVSRSSTRSSPRSSRRCHVRAMPRSRCSIPCSTGWQNPLNATSTRSPSGAGARWLLRAPPATEGQSRTRAPRLNPWARTRTPGSGCPCRRPASAARRRSARR